MNITDLLEATTDIRTEQNKIAFMTLGEYLDSKNPREKMHSSESYQTTLKELNSTINYYNVYRSSDVQIDENKKAYFISYYYKLVAIYDKDNHILYHNKDYKNKGKITWLGHSNKDIVIDPVESKQVKYLHRISPKFLKQASENLNEFPYKINTIKYANEIFMIRAEEKPEKNKGISIAILNEKLEIVAEATNEWGATLLRVAKEYRGKRLGALIGKYWYEYNPDFKSGGYTPSGLTNARYLWADAVQDTLNKGIYSNAIRMGTISKDKVKSILDQAKEIWDNKKPLKVKDDTNKKKDVVIMTNNDDYVLIYDKAIFDIEDPNEQEDEVLKQYIYGHGFLRQTQGKTIIYDHNYDEGFRELLLYGLLQQAKDMGEKITFGIEASDIIEYESLSKATIQGNQMFLEKDVMNLQKSDRVSQHLFKTNDKYGELYNRVIELAHSKWE